MGSSFVSEVVVGNGPICDNCDRGLSETLDQSLFRNVEEDSSVAFRKPIWTFAPSFDLEVVDF